MAPAYYIAKGQKTLGPCTLDDLRQFLAYGSIQNGDLVMRDGEQQWRPVATLLEIAGSTLQATEEKPSILPRRRTVRYRDYARVPPQQQSGKVVMWMVTGFLLFPPLLWRAAHAIYSERIFSRQVDENGYLTHWPRWPEVFVTALIVMNGLLWLSLAATAWNQAGPMIREFIHAFRDGMKAAGDLF